MPNDWKEILEGITKNLSPEITKLEQVEGFAEFKQHLIRVINYLLQHDLERLVQAMYRWDIAEKYFKDALSDTDPAACLANLIIKREFERIEFKKRYSAG